jgi:hypothetical protein
MRIVIVASVVIQVPDGSWFSFTGQACTRVVKFGFYVVVTVKVTVLSLVFSNLVSCHVCLQLLNNLVSCHLFLLLLNNLVSSFCVFLLVLNNLFLLLLFGDSEHSDIFKWLTGLFPLFFVVSATI